MRPASHAFRLTVAVLVSLVCARTLHAQIGIAVASGQKAYIQHESVVVKLTVKNGTSSPIQLGKSSGAARVVFEVKTKRDGPVRRLKPGPALPNVSLQPDEQKEFEVDLLKHYNMHEMGNYSVSAVLSLGRKRYRSAKAFIDVVHGIELKKKDRSVPGYPDDVRTYSLRYWTRGGSERLFLCVGNKEKKRSYGVFELGPLIRAQEVELEVASDGNVVVIHQCGVDCFLFSYFKSSRDGVTRLRREYRLPDGNPYPMPEEEPPTEKKQPRIDPAKFRINLP